MNFQITDEDWEKLMMKMILTKYQVSFSPLSQISDTALLSPSSLVCPSTPTHQTALSETEKHPMLLKDNSCCERCFIETETVLYKFQEPTVTLIQHKKDSPNRYINLSITAWMGLRKVMAVRIHQ